MRPYSGFNRGHILIVIDVLSKSWAVPLKSKSGSETANVIAETIRARWKRSEKFTNGYGEGIL